MEEEEGRGAEEERGAEPGRVEAEKPELSNLGHDEYVARLLEWFADQRIEGRVDWHRIRALSFEFGEYHSLAAPSEMSLAKALARRGLRRGYRYLRPHERGYRTQVERGGRRPRALWLELPKAEISSLSSAVHQLDRQSKATRSA